MTDNDQHIRQRTLALRPTSLSFSNATLITSELSSARKTKGKKKRQEDLDCPDFNRRFIFRIDLNFLLYYFFFPRSAGTRKLQPSNQIIERRSIFTSYSSMRSRKNEFFVVDLGKAVNYHWNVYARESPRNTENLTQEKHARWFSSSKSLKNNPLSPPPKAVEEESEVTQVL